MEIVLAVYKVHNEKFRDLNQVRNGWERPAKSGTVGSRKELDAGTLS